MEVKMAKCLHTSWNDYVYKRLYSSNNITTTGANIIYYAYIDEYFLGKIQRQWNKSLELIMEEKSRHYKSSKSLEQSKCICCGETLSDNNISTANSFEADFDSIIQDGRQKLAGFFVKFDANGERIWGSYYWGSINLSIDSSEKIYISGETFADKNIHQMLIK
jgi:hypothetical protein